jgi:hypothetical protein
MLPGVEPHAVIPLFPLPLVVLPGEILPLHIFEERYKTMIADCRRGEEGGGSLPFGIALARGQDVHAAHQSIVRVVRVSRQSARHRHRRTDPLPGARGVRDRPYHTAAVDYLVGRDEPLEAALRRRAVGAFDRLGRLTTVPSAGAAISGGGWRRSGSAPALADPLEKQHLSTDRAAANSCSRCSSD